MKAIVRYEYGGPEVLKLEEIEKPKPRDDETLVKVHAASANLGDWEILRADPFYIAVMAKLFGPKPRHPPLLQNDTPTPRRRRGLLPKYKVLGSDVAGEVEAVGKDVTRHVPGDEVFGMCFFGAFAEYVCVPNRAPLVPKPATMSFEEAASLPQATFIAVQGLCDKGQLQAGQKVLINGAGGGAGTLAVQIAKSIGAEVTAVDNDEKQDLMRSLGADRVIDYRRDDFTRIGERYDLILDLVALRSVFDCKRALRPGGRYISAGGPMGPVFQSMLLGPLISMMGSEKVIFLMAQDRAEDLALINELVAAGEVKPIIDKRYPLSEVPEALRYMGEGHALGKVIITV